MNTLDTVCTNIEELLNTQKKIIETLEQGRDIERSCELENCSYIMFIQKKGNAIES